MPFDEKNPSPAPTHRITLDQDGSLIIHGSDLHIEKLSLDGGDLLVQGEVDALTYEEEVPSSFLSRLFRG